MDLDRNLYCKSHMFQHTAAAIVAHSPGLGELLAEDSQRRTTLPPGRQWGSQGKESPSDKKAKQKGVLAWGEDGRLHTPPEVKVSAKERRLDWSKPLKKRSGRLKHREPKSIRPTEPGANSSMPAEATTRVDTNDGWPVDRICSVCKCRFNTSSQLTRHLADPALHLEHSDHSLLRVLAVATKTSSSSAAGPPSFLAQKRNPKASSQALQELSQDRIKHGRGSKKRSWEEYTESGVVSISSSDKSSPAPFMPPAVAIMPQRDPPRSPTKDRPYLFGSDPLSPQSNDTVRSGLTFELSPPVSPAKPIAEPVLCPEQRKLCETIMSGRNVFYTGSAGCGKSTVLKNFVRRLKAQLVWKAGEWKEPKQVDIIAPTGRAALDINGSTFWTYAGWNPDSMKKPLEKLKDDAEYGKWVRKRLRATDVLVIDEISMMENHHLERLNEIMQSARGNVRAFGGVQLVVTGDFCQLPPVKPFAFCYKCGKGLLKSKTDTIFTCPSGHGEWHDSEKWAFCSSAWEAADFVHVNLTTIHRQSDRVFIDILQKCRLGVPFTSQEENLLLQHESQTGNAIKLFSTRQEVGAVNREAFNRLQTPQRTYNCYDDFRCYNRLLESKGRRSDYDGTLDALREHRFDPRIDLKQGMVVVLLVNLDQENGLVNGSQGVIMGFERAEDSKMPEAIKKDDKDFSRMGSGPVLTGEHAEVREANIRIFMETATNKEWPIVLFQNRITRTIYADCRVTELGDEAPYSLISRTQLPLVAGWAMTVHKSQGMTLNRVVVNLSKSFEEGQMYVALSRARSLEGQIGRAHV